MTKTPPPKTPAPQATLERIQKALTDLELPQMRQALDQSLAEPEPDQGRLDWLWALVEPQIQARLERRVERRIKESRLPVRKTFGEFNWDFQPGLDRDHILELATLRFLSEGKNLLLGGESGTGKSHIAQALALLACMDNRRVRYTTSAGMLADLNASLADNTLEEALKPYVRADLLLLDEVGLEQVERKMASRSGLMQKVLFPRYNAKRSTVITSNIPWEAWADYLDDQFGATAILDRLLHHSHVFSIVGPSYRDWVHQQEVEGRREGRRRAPDRTGPGSQLTSPIRQGGPS
jgi:DNA replication protein DnaC